MAYKNFSRFINDRLILSHSLIDYSTKESSSVMAENAYQIRLFKKGGFLWTIEDKTYHIEDNYIAITYPTERHAYTYKNECTVDRFHIKFTPQILDSDVLDYLPRDLHVIPISSGSFLAQLFDKIDFWCSKLDGKMLETMLIHTVEEILCTLTLPPYNNIPQIDEIENPLFSKIIRYIEANIHSNITLDMICDYAYIDKTYLHYIFKKQLNITPKKYIHSKKMTYAQQDIRNGEIPTKVYLNYGFQNYSTFYRAYTKCFGHAPSNEFLNQKITIISSNENSSSNDNGFGIIEN